MTSALVTLLFVALVTPENIYEDVPMNKAVAYPTMLPKGFVVTASAPQVEQAEPKMICKETSFCFEVIPGALGAYVKGIMHTSVASVVFTGKGHSTGLGVAYINQNSTIKEPTYPNQLRGQLTYPVADKMELLDIYGFNWKPGKIEAFDGLTAVTNLSSPPVLGLYSPLFLPSEQQKDYRIVVINLPKDATNYTLTFNLPDNTNRTYYFRRNAASKMLYLGSQFIYFGASEVLLTGWPNNFVESPGVETTMTTIPPATNFYSFAASSTATNRTDYFRRRQSKSNTSNLGSQFIHFEAPARSSSPTIAPNTTSGFNFVFPFYIFLWSFVFWCTHCDCH